MLPRIPYAEAARNLLRDSVLAAVDELVRSNGWAATSVANIAKLAGVSRQTVYNEFGSRQSIAEAYVMHRLNTLLDHIDEVMRAHIDDPEVGLRQVLGAGFDILDEPLIHTVMANGGIGSQELIDLIKVTNEQSTSRIAALMREIHPQFTERDALIFADTLVRISVTHAIAPTLDRDEAIDRMVRMAMFFLAAVPDAAGASATGNDSDQPNSV